jgi:glycosyltransferase involved in cell wall biosynthesis
MVKPRVAIGLEYPLGLRGGVSVVVETLIRGLTSDFDIYLLSPDKKFKDVPEGGPANIAGQFNWSPHGRVGSRSYAKGVKQAVAWMRAQGTEILHLHCGGVYGWGNRYPFCSLARAADKAGISVLWTDHLVVSPTSGICGANKPMWFKNLLLPLAWWGKIDQLRHVRKEIAVSDHDQTKLRRWYWPMRDKFSRMYHSRLPDRNGTDTTELLEQREKLILNVGHVAFRKGQHILADSFAQIAAKYPDWCLVLAGHDGGDGCWQKIQQIRTNHGLDKRIVLLGQQHNVVSLFRRASIYVQPSFQEALGLALQEAIFYGCPAIGTQVGGIPELIDSGVNGILVPPARTDLLAQSLEGLIGDPDLRQRYGAGGREMLMRKRMTQDAMLANHRKLYVEQLKQSAKLCCS